MDSTGEADHGHFHDVDVAEDRCREHGAHDDLRYAEQHEGEDQRAGN